MFRVAGSKRTIVSILILLCSASMLFSAKPKKPKTNLVKQEAGYYYGFGEGATPDQAKENAKYDLIVNSLTSTIRINTPSAEKVSLKKEACEARLPNIKVFTQSKDGLTVALRIKIEDWDKEESLYAESLRENLAKDWKKVASGNSTSEKLSAAERILVTIADNGESLHLTYQADSSELYSEKVEKSVSKILKGLQFDVSNAGKIISPDSTIAVTVKDAEGFPVENLKLKGIWKTAELNLSADYEEHPEAENLIKTDHSGTVELNFPSNEGFQDKPVVLTLSTTFAEAENASAGMRKLDEFSEKQSHFFCTEKENFIETLKVEGGKFKTGAVPQDTKAFASREKARDVEVASFEIAATPITNLQYNVYLFLNEIDEEPEYFLNPDYNNENQPVISVSAENAEAFARWLSKVTGDTYRLPTDDEWEIAARGGEEIIFAWGDENPSLNKIANYKGNGEYNSPSPVGSFPASTNSLGIKDMCGNVWEWTSSSRGAGNDVRTVKGGSWLDGPSELRISNYKNINKDECLPDVGFRLIKEIK